MFVGAETVVDVVFDVAQVRLANLARGGWLADASDVAYGELGQAPARSGPVGLAPGVSRLVDVHFRDLVRHGRLAVMALRWEATGPGVGLFPAMDADLTLLPYGEGRTLLTLTGAYRTPLGAVGRALDRAVLHRVAVATVQRFVTRIGTAIADPAVATAPEPAREKFGWLELPLAAEET